MSAIPARRPFLPNELPRSKPGSVVARAAFVAAKHQFRYAEDASTSVERVSAQTYPNDSLLPKLVTRSATSPASLTGTGWAAELATPAITADYVSSMASQSVAARLIDASGTKLTFNGAAAINVPARTTAPSADVQWVVENGPMPVLQFTLAALTLTPKKLAAAAAVSQQLIHDGNGDVVIGQMLKEDLAYSLDATMFSATAASASRPAGLLAGLTTLGATTGGGIPAMTSDIAKLFTSVASVGNADDIAIIASPGQAAALQMQPRSGALRVWSTRALAAGTVVAVDVNGFISAFSPLPRIDASGEAVADFNDSTPAAFSTVGSPNTVAGTLRSAFQTDAVIVRLILTACWVARPGSVAMITGATW